MDSTNCPPTLIFTIVGFSLTKYSNDKVLTEEEDLITSEFSSPREEKLGIKSASLIPHWFSIISDE
ncbi:hypothetical protein DAT299_06380 [Streptococcus suis]|nr:hypothetical protein DAT299_06380 [Streptococcus suis]